MYYIVNFITSSNIGAIRNNWKSVSNSFIKTPGIHSVNLYEVSLSFYAVSGVNGAQKEAPVNYQLVSIMTCGDLDQFKKAKNSLLSQPEINQLNNSEECGLVVGKETICQTHYSEGTLQLDTKNTLLINPFEITADEVKPCLEMWHAACEAMVKNEGFIGVNFLKAIDPESKFKFINFAEWRSKDDIISAHENPLYEEHRKRGSVYKKYPSLCTHLSTIGSNLNPVKV